VPFRLLAPIVIVLCTFGTFTVNGSIIEVGIMLACGVLGFFMRRFGMSPAALVIALVLGPLAEETLRQTMVVSGGDMTIFLERTTSMWLLVVIAVLLLLPVAAPLLKRIVTAQVRDLGRRRRTQQRAESTRTPRSDEEARQPVPTSGEGASPRPGDDEEDGR
jgi:putative tricarboxylic transport membrane protein